MKPEQILQSQFLDILFDNRNKQYGAYALRKGYNMRLVKSTSAMLLIALAVCLFLKWNMNNKHVQVFPPLIYMQEVELKNIKEEIIKPKIPEPVSSSPINKHAEQFMNTTITIVDDDQANNKLHTQAELDDKLIGGIDKPGDHFNGIPDKPAEVVGKSKIVSPVEIKVPEVVKPIYNAQVMPEFPGGKDGLMRFMLRHLREPDHLQEGQRFVVMVRFVVGIDGSITNSEIVKSGGEFDHDVLKVINKMPKWKPGKQDGKPVPVYFQMPVTFEGREY